MRPDSLISKNKFRFHNRGYRLVRTVLFTTMLFLLASAAFGQSHRKLAADFAKTKVRADGMVDVIIQFKHAPLARHFQMMATQGGKLRNRFDHIHGAAYRIPVRMLNFLEQHPDVAYVTPDRPNKPSYDSE